MLVLDPGLVLAQPLDGHAAMLQAEAGCSDGRVGEEEEHDDAPSRAECAAAGDQSVNAINTSPGVRLLT